MTAATLTWLQLSDMHVRLDHKTDHERSFAALAQDVARLAEERVCPDVVFLVGDIAHAGKPEEYDLALELLTPVLEAAGVSVDRVYAVAGNHDVDRDATDSAIETPLMGLWQAPALHAACDAIFDGPHAATLDAKFAAYRDFRRQLAAVEDCTLQSWTQTLAVGDHTVALFGVNSSWMCGSDALDAATVPIIGRRQRELLSAQMAADADATLVLQHHPAESIRHADMSEHVVWLAEKQCVCLCGHVHESSNVQVTSPDGGYLISTGGALYEGYAYPKRYLWGQLDIAANTTLFGLRRSAETGSFYVPDADRHRNAPGGLLQFTGPAPRGAEEDRRTEMRIVLDAVDLQYLPDPDSYQIRFTKHLANDTNDAQEGLYARIAVNAFPDDAERSRSHYREHPLELEAVGFTAACDTRDVRCELLHDADANKELMLMFEGGGAPAPLEPGEEAVVTYSITIPRSQWGPFLERNVRVLTDRLQCRLTFPVDTVAQVVSVDNPHLQRKEASQEAGVVVEQRDGLEIYEWERIAPARNARHRLVWTFAAEGDAPGP
ncbi:MAG: metallophosphoesterase family protein [Solirubrobacteraceae bacterium]